MFAKRRLQFGVRTVFFVVLVAALPLAWLSIEVGRAHLRGNAIKEIERLGGSLWYSDELDESGLPRMVTSRPPSWARDLLGDQFFLSVSKISLKGTRADDRVFKYLEQFPDLAILDLSDTAVSDRGMASFEKCRNLRMLWLAGTRVSDEGMHHLRNLERLQILDVARTSVTDEGIKHLTALRDLRHLDITSTSVSGRSIFRLYRASHLSVITNSSAPFGFEQHLFFKGMQTRYVMSQVEVPLLVRELNDTDWSVRQRTIERLGGFASISEAAVWALFHKGLKDKHPEVRVTAVQGLAYIADNDARCSALLDCIKDSSAKVRNEAIHQLTIYCTRSHDAVLGIIVYGLVDSDPGVRLAAAQSLTSFSSPSSPETIAAIETALANPSLDGDARELATFAWQGWTGKAQDQRTPQATTPADPDNPFAN